MVEIRKFREVYGFGGVQAPISLQNPILASFLIWFCRNDAWTGSEYLKAICSIKVHSMISSYYEAATVYNYQG